MKAAICVGKKFAKKSIFGEKKIAANLAKDRRRVFFSGSL